MAVKLFMPLCNFSGVNRKWCDWHFGCRCGMRHIFVNYSLFPFLSYVVRASCCAFLLFLFCLKMLRFIPEVFPSSNEFSDIAYNRIIRKLTALFRKVIHLKKKKPMNYSLIILLPCYTFSKFPSRHVNNTFVIIIMII